VSENGGDLSPLTTVDKSRAEQSHEHPQLLPDGRVLYIINSKDAAVDGVYVSPEDFAQPGVRVLPGAAKAAYLPGPDDRPGHLLWVDGRALVAQSFDLRTLTLSGPRATIADGVAVIPNRAAFWTAGGTIAYFLGDDVGPQRMSWYDRDGRILSDVAAEDLYRSVRLSHDGSRIGVIRTVQNDPEVWVFELSRGHWVRLGSSGFNLGQPFWSPDDRDLAFGRQGTLSRRSGSGVGSETVMAKMSPAQGTFQDWSNDGTLLLMRRPVDGQSDLWIRSLADEREWSVAETPHQEPEGRFSPDGQWVAYSSDQTGRFEVYVQRTSGATRKWQVSLEGGDRPVWRHDGKELYFVGLKSNTIHAATVRTVGKGLEFEKPVELFTTPRPLMFGWQSNYDVARDGRFLILTGENRGPAVLTVVLNWHPR
jgi:hypothetical protein